MIGVGVRLLAPLEGGYLEGGTGGRFSPLSHYILKKCGVSPQFTLAQLELGAADVKQSDS